MLGYTCSTLVMQDIEMLFVKKQEIRLEVLNKKAVIKITMELVIHFSILREAFGGLAYRNAKYFRSSELQTRDLLS